MTATGAEIATAIVRPSLLPVWRRAAVFGTGFGIVIEERNLEAVIVKARPAGATLVAETTIADFRNRPAAEWGADLLRFLAAAGENRLAATIVLPRDEVIVRTVKLPGVADQDIASAIALQIDSLHPWDDEEVLWGWSRVGRDELMAGFVRKDLLNSHETLFAEAGIPIAAVTFSPAVIHGAVRVWNSQPASLLGFQTDSRGRTEVYGESESRCVFSAVFPFAADKALGLARAELRMSADGPVYRLSDALPAAVNGKAASSVVAYAAAVAGSAPRSARFANLLPAERRAAHNRLQYVMPGILAALLLIAAIGVFTVFPTMEQRRYRQELDRAARQLEPKALRVQSLEKTIKADRLKIAALDDFRTRPQADLDVLNELTRLLPPPVWTSAIEIHPDTVIISGEADQAAPLLKTLDSSPLFQNSEFALSVTRNKQSESFRIKTLRRGRAGRTIP